MNKSSSDKLDLDLSSEIKQKVIDWIEKLWDKINENWWEFNKRDNIKDCEIYGMMNNQKDDNPLHVITSDCNAVVENLSN